MPPARLDSGMDPTARKVVGRRVTRLAHPADV